MKKFNFIILFIFFIFNLYSQNRGIIYIGQRFNAVEYKDFIGLQPICQDKLEENVEILKNSLLTNNPEFKVIQYNLYPPLTYIKKEDGNDVMKKNAIDFVSQHYNNYLLILVNHNSNGDLLEVSFTFKLDPSALSQICYNSMSFIESKVNKELEKEISGITMSNFECTISDKVLSISSFISNGCMMNDSEKAAWFEENDYESIQIDNINYFRVSEYREPLGNNNSRMSCEHLDFTGHKLHFIEKEGEASRPIFDYLSQIFGETGLENINLYVTDYANSLDVIQQVDNILENRAFPCDRAIHMYFTVNKTCRIKYFNKEEIINYETLKSDYKLKQNEFQDKLGISFRFKSKKDEIINFIQSLQSENFASFPLLSGVATGSAEYFAGVIAGFADSMIEIVDLTLIVMDNIGAWAAWLEKKNQTYNIFSYSWFADLIQYKNKQRNFFEAFRDKFGDSMNAWYELGKSAYKTISDIFAFEGKVNPLIYFIEAIIKPLGNFVKDLLFINGVFDAGYAMGQAIFEGFNPVAFFGKAKGAAKLIKESGKQILGTMAVNFAQKVTEIEIKNRLLSLGVQTFEKFVIRLQNISATKVMDWYKSTMPHSIKKSLASWPESLNPRMLKLNTLINDKSVRDYFESKKDEALNAWLQCDNSFPGVTWCIH